MYYINIEGLVVNFNRLMKLHELVMNIYGIKMQSGDAGGLRTHVKLWSGQFLWPDIQPDIRTKTKIYSIHPHAIPITPVKFHV